MKKFLIDTISWIAIIYVMIFAYITIASFATWENHYDMYVNNPGYLFRVPVFAALILAFFFIE